MVDLDQFVTKDVIPINEKEVDALPVMAMKLSVTPIVHTAAQCTIVSDHLTLVEDLEHSVKQILGPILFIDLELL